MERNRLVPKVYMWKFRFAMVIIALANLGLMLYLVKPARKHFGEEVKLQPLVYLDAPELHFVASHSSSLKDALCILLAVKHQHPTRVFIHTDASYRMHGKYWRQLMRAPEVIKILEILYTPDKRGQHLRKHVSKWHAVHLSQQGMLREYGRIYLGRQHIQQPRLVRYCEPPLPCISCSMFTGK